MADLNLDNAATLNITVVRRATVGFTVGFYNTDEPPVLQELTTETVQMDVRDSDANLVFRFGGTGTGDGRGSVTITDGKAVFSSDKFTAPAGTYTHDIFVKTAGGTRTRRAKGTFTVSQNSTEIA